MADSCPPGPKFARTRQRAMKTAISVAPCFLVKLKASERSRGVRRPYVKEPANGQDTGLIPPDATAQNAVCGLKPGTSRQLSSPGDTKTAGGGSSQLR
jgi:hypothetical protein